MSANKTSVVLKDSKDWTKWVEIIRTAALKHDIWKYVDPNTPKESRPDHNEPIMPRPEDVRKPQETPVLLSDLTIDEREYFTFLLDMHKRRRKKYDRQVEALSDLRKKIQETVHPDYLRYTMGCDHVHEMMLSLKAGLAPKRQQELIAEWNALCKKPKENQDIDVWIDKWAFTYHDCRDFNLAEFTDTRPHYDSRPHYDFLNATQQLHPIWSDLTRHNIIRGEDIDFEELLQSLRKYRRTIKAVQQGSAGQHIAFATSFQNQYRDGKNTAPTCFCKEKHFYRKCPYVIEALRPPKWLPDRDIQEAFDTRMENDYKFRGRITRARKSYKD